MACTYNLIQQRTSSLNEREDKLSAQVEATVSLVQHYYDQRQTLGEEAAKQQALDAIKALRYDESNYFWILDQKMQVVMHPIKPALNGQNARTLKTVLVNFTGEKWSLFLKQARRKGSLTISGRARKASLKIRFPTFNFSLSGAGLSVQVY